ncbi:MAG TPA: glycosyltransferase N-terminal domain-containing protein [Bacteroidales bacterium]|nr:glycosyltransferase N-terminal domain-containing protein [Bacteroidales bacterium]HNS47204.1 glycosyltransferase N-terminal domain-containing protein [Bacteroidales bacterium]
MRFLYTLSILIYGLAIRVMSLFQRKAALWVSGRRKIFERLSDFKKSSSAPILWFHCASLGEFEQGRPLIERVKATFPEHRLLLTFFSPSGYEIQKHYPLASLVSYLPLDTPWNAKKFIKTVRPERVFFIKYEYWYNFLSVLARNNIRVYIIAAAFRPRQVFFRWYGTWFRKQLRRITCLFVQNELSFRLLEHHGIKNAIVCGDTRFDRVKAIADHPRHFPEIQKFIDGHPVIIAGSTWPEDEELLIRFTEKKSVGLRFVIAPHEVHPERIQSLIKRIGQSALTYSSLLSAGEVTAEILIIDSIGILSHLYQYATVAYIGGGFGKGIHNILEAAAFGIPVLFGPHYGNFQEAADLIHLKGAFSITSEDELIRKAEELMADPVKYKKAAGAAFSYVKDHTGATDIILDFIQTIQ